MKRTTKSPRGGKWTAGAMVFSGRPDPVWELATVQAEALVALWREWLPVADVPSPRAVLGYRGCWLRAPHGECWRAFDGVVVHEPVGAPAADARSDRERRFERTLLATAPAGLLPPGAAT